MSDLIGKSLGRYHILEQLGEGGMATVYKAYDTRLETDVAVKVIRTENILPSVLERTLKRFEREAKSLARLTHPNIVKVTDYGEFEGKPYLVMPYLPGGTLKQKLGKPIAWRATVRFLLPIARALAYAHEQGVIHRDVKPSNILLTDKSQPMLTDFGVAKLYNMEETADLTGTGMGVGTPEYMAPEQWQGQVSPQTDVYALGMVMYEMVTGCRPYMANTPAALLLKQATEPLPRPKGFVPTLPDGVEMVLFQALAKNPKSRYVDMSMFMRALEGLLSEQTEEARLPTRNMNGQDNAATEHLANNALSQKISPRQSATASKQRSSWLRYWPIGVVGVLIILGLTMVLGIPFLQSFDRAIPSATPTVVLTEEPIIPNELLNLVDMALTEVDQVQPTMTADTYQTATVAAALTQAVQTQQSVGLSLTPTVISADEIIDSKGVAMRLVPEGTFTMGRDVSDDSNESPAHDVYLDAFYMDKYEVTNALYKACVIVGVCNSPKSTSHYNNSYYENHPVVYVDWNMAKTYCEWRGAGLPTEAQWEKAARGTDARIFPWGKGISCAQANYNDGDSGYYDKYCVGDTTAVGSYESGKSSYGIYDLAGNVWEWVADWYSGKYYQDSQSENPFGPSSGSRRVLRGGSWGSLDLNVHSAFRYTGYPTYADYLVGFRCSRPHP